MSLSYVAVDAVKNKVGIGIKTFRRGNNQTVQKVAEFNYAKDLYSGLKEMELIKKIAELRNRRLEVVEDEFELSSLIYHCIIREQSFFSLFEESMDKIQVEDISKIMKSRNTLHFDDGLHDYAFNLSKSTLFKRFRTDTCEASFGIEILEDPFGYLEKHKSHTQVVATSASSPRHDEICLPLYSDSKNAVKPSSGLNAWNSKPRPNQTQRDPNEASIGVPSWIHKSFPEFFPARGVPFNLRLPSGNNLNANVGGGSSRKGKDLRSAPNSELGMWILRNVLKLEEGELVTDEHLQEVGIDSVKVEKLGDFDFAIDFASFGSFETFKDIYKP